MNADSYIPPSESVCGQRTHEFVINVKEQELSPIIHLGLIFLFLLVLSRAFRKTCMPLQGQRVFQPFITDFSIDPTDRYPLGCGTDLVNRLFQFPDCFVNIIVHNFQVKVVSVSFLQEFTLCG